VNIKWRHNIGSCARFWPSRNWRVKATMKALTRKRYCTLLVFILLTAGCATGQVHYDVPKDEVLDIDSARFAALRDKALEIAESGRRSVAEGTRKLSLAGRKLHQGEQMVADGLRNSERAVKTESPERMAESAEQTRKGNALILESRQEIEAAQRQIREGRMKLEVAAELLRELGTERVPGTMSEGENE